MVAELPTPIIGADFIRQFVLLLDVKHHKLIDTTTSLTVWGIINHTPSISPMFLKATSHSRYDTLLREFPENARPVCRDCEIKHSTTHHIVTRGPPGAARPRHLAPQII